MTLEQPERERPEREGDASLGGMPGEAGPEFTIEPGESGLDVPPVGEGDATWTPGEDPGAVEEER